LTSLLIKNQRFCKERSLPSRKRSAKAAARAAGEEARRKKQDKARGIVREEDVKKPSKFDKNRYDSKQKSTKKVDATHEAEVNALKSGRPINQTLLRMLIKLA
jgi:hypothetical protein